MTTFLESSEFKEGCKLGIKDAKNGVKPQFKNIKHLFTMVIAIN